ncbi:YdeI/OmpD-associated family protein [Amycolatopsis aidingensis]|uniref:YdeI/OmpD-associated family protein n=1 Tax=Amycolatopsis aidingensis TaxID=2842453 RepID=UPI001C0C0CF2|nr:YdeI/OmpD-associated family protein [Amycolatopsis aidingensis]
MSPAHTFTSIAEFEDWLETHHRSTDEIWVALPKIGTEVPSITRGQALDVALCFGWIDGKATSQTTPEGWWAQRFTPRGRRSKWSKINRVKVERLIREGRMRQAGLDQIELAKSDGRWAAAYDSPSRAQVPEELQVALAANPAAGAAFAELGAGARYQLLHSLQTVKKAETRARKIAGYVERLAAGQPPHPKEK